MIVLVTGGRGYTKRDMVWKVLDALHATQPFTKVVHGAGGKADMAADAWAKDHAVPVQPYPAPWSDISRPDAVIRTRRDGTKYDAKQGINRNQQMLDEEDVELVVAFPGGNGTADMTRRARKAGIQLVVVVTEEKRHDGHC